MSKNLKTFLVGISVLGAILIWAGGTVLVMERDGTWPGLIASGFILAVFALIVFVMYRFGDE